MTVSEQLNYCAISVLQDIYDQWEKGLLTRKEANLRILLTAENIEQRAREQYRIAKAQEEHTNKTKDC